MKAAFKRSQWFPPRPRALSGIHAQLVWGCEHGAGAERNEHFSPGSRINKKELPIRFNQTKTGRAIRTRSNPVILFVSLLSDVAEKNKQTE